MPSVLNLTPPSVALYAMTVCMIKWAVRPFMQMDSAYSVDLHGFVMSFLAVSSFQLHNSFPDLVCSDFFSLTPYAHHPIQESKHFDL